MQNKYWRLSVITAATLAVTVVGGCATGNINNQQTNTAPTQTSSTGIQDKVYSGPVVATYSGGSLTKQELDEQYNLQVVLPGLQNETKKDFVSFYITFYKQMYNEAMTQLKPTIDVNLAKQNADKLIHQLYSSPQLPYKTQQDVLNKMNQLGLSKDDLIRYYEKYQVIEDFIKEQIKNLKVTDAQAQAFYNQHPEDFTTVTVNHILLHTLSEAEKVEAILKSGADFAKTADKYSIDPSVKENHGQFPDAQASSFVAPFAKACVTLPIGQISNPVHTQFGYHIMRVDKRTITPFSQVKSEIEQQLLQQLQNNREMAIYRSALQAANVKIIAKDSDL